MRQVYRAYLVEFEWFDSSDKTTSDGFSGGPEGWKQTSYRFEENSDVSAKNKAIETIENTGYRLLRKIKLWRSVSFPMPDRWDSTKPDMQAMAPAMITKIRP